MNGKMAEKMVVSPGKEWWDLWRSFSAVFLNEDVAQHIRTWIDTPSAEQRGRFTEAVLSVLQAIFSPTDTQHVRRTLRRHGACLVEDGDGGLMLITCPDATTGGKPVLAKALEVVLRSSSSS